MTSLTSCRAIFVGVFTAIGILLLVPASGKAAEGVATFISGSDTADLVCPGQHAAVAHPVEPQPSEPSHLPSLTELGALAHTVVRDQSLIDPHKIPAFALPVGANTRPLNVAIWGDSHTAAGSFTPTLISTLRSHGLTVGSHFLPPSMGRANVHLEAVRSFCIGQSWQTELAFTATGTVQTGPALINRTAAAGPESYLWLDLRSQDKQARLHQLQLVYRAPVAAELNVSINGGPEQALPLPADTASRTLILRADQPIGVVKLQVSKGQLVLHGFVLDYVAPPQVTFDVLSLPSATVRGWANIDTAYMAKTLPDTTYDAVILEYGTNEGNEPHFNEDAYATTLTTSLTHMREVFPNASCVLVGPPDRGVLASKQLGPRDILTYSRIHQSIESVQAKIGPQFGCVAWNWQDLMGGPGGSYGWALHTPPLMGRDVTHLTKDGYKRTAEALAQSLNWSPNVQ